MAWTYGAWAEESGAAAQLAMLRQHRTEVAAKLGPEIAADGSSRSANVLMRYLETIDTQMERLENVTGENRREVGVIRADFGGGGAY